MKIARLAVPAMVCALAACGSIHVTPVSTASATPRGRAASDAAANQASFVAPRGARRRASAPALLSQAPLTIGQLDNASYWQAAGSPATVLAWVRAHLPSRFTLLASGTEGGFYMTPYHAGITVPSSGPRLWYDEFGLPAVAGELPVRILVVSVASAGSGQTSIRVDAEDSWSMVRTAAQRVPSTVSAVTITQVRPVGPVGVGGTSIVTSPGLVRKILNLANGLPLYATGVAAPCPAQLAPGLRISFLDHAGGPVAATATVDAATCGTVSMVINGHEMLLGGGTQFERQVEAIAGLSGVNPGGPMRKVTAG
jgi:hypothetical protein